MIGADMRVIKVKHTNGLGEREYIIYETVEQLNAHLPDAVVRTKLSEAFSGDYMVSANGWVVPILKIVDLTNKYYKVGFERRKRTKQYVRRVFHFPKQKFCVSLHKLDDVEFNYSPKNNVNISSTGVRNRMYEVTTRKIMWAQYVATGTDPVTATQLVYPNVFNKNRLTKSLLLNDKLIAFIEERSDNAFEKALNNNNLGPDFMAHTLKAIVEDKKSPPQLKKYALQLIMKILKIEF